MRARLSLRVPRTATAPGQPSWTAAVPELTVAVHCPGSAPVVISAGQVRVGFSASVPVTVTVWVQVAWLPAASAAVQVMVVVPGGYSSSNPLPSLRTPRTARGAPGQASLAVASAVTWAPQNPASWGTSTD